MLGALKTVITHILAWLTEQKMPIRFRQAKDRYRIMVKAIKTSKRIFAEIDLIDWPKGQRPDPIQKRNKLDEMFEGARMDQEANYPEVHYDPSANQTPQTNQDLQDKAKKWKEQEYELKSEVEVLREELKATKKPAKAVLTDDGQ